MTGSKRGLRRLAVLFAVASVGVLAVGAHAASAQVIEICKSSANGMSGRTFQYSISGGAQVSVNGGRCSGPITVAANTVTITEAQSSPATDVYSTTVRPSLRKVSEDLVNRSVTVTTGASTSSETLVTFTNQPAGGNLGTLKVCKLTQTPAYLGRLFSFSANGGPLVSTEANDAFDDPANWSCRILGSFQVGSNVTVHEAIPAGTEVQFIDSDPATALADFNTSTGDALITVGAGVTVVLYDDEPLPPSGTGWLELCKDPAWLDQWHQDPDVHGSFHFDVTDAAGATYSRDVLVGQCSEPFEVAAGIAEVTEAPATGYDLVDVQTVPADRLLTTNLINRTADVEVPASSDSNDETQVHFFNQTQRGQLKICKALGQGSSDLVGKTFWFDLTDVTDPDNPYPYNYPVSIKAAASTQCVIVGNFPIGNTIDVEEDIDHSSGGSGEFIDTTGGGLVTIRPGINTTTITNTARGLLEICKQVRRGEFATTTPFVFRIDGGSPINVRAGTCSLPQRVSVGNHTVTELSSANTNYELDPNAPGNGITVNPADREVSRSLAMRSITVSVPYGPNGETLVTFYNRVKRFTAKICKVIPSTSSDSLGTKPFSYDVYLGSATTGPHVTLGPIYPGECTFYTPDIPILTSTGAPQVFTVHEQGTPSPTWDVTSITLTGGTVITTDKGNGNITFSPGAGINVITYTNKAKDP
jgi:hypothetical protein